MPKFQTIIAPVFNEDEFWDVRADIVREFKWTTTYDFKEIKKMFIPGTIHPTHEDHVLMELHTRTHYILINDLNLLFILIDMSDNVRCSISPSRYDMNRFKEYPIQIHLTFDGESILTDPKLINNPTIDRILISRDSYNQLEDYIIRGLIKLVSHNNILNIDEILCRLPETKDDYINHLISTSQSE